MFVYAGHNSLEGDHSTDTTTMTAVSNSGAADSSSGGNNLGAVGGGSMYALTAGSEHTYHRHLHCYISGEFIYLSSFMLYSSPFKLL